MEYISVMIHTHIMERMQFWTFLLAVWAISFRKTLYNWSKSSRNTGSSLSSTSSFFRWSRTPLTTTPLVGLKTRSRSENTEGTLLWMSWNGTADSTLSGSQKNLSRIWTRRSSSNPLFSAFCNQAVRTRNWKSRRFSLSVIRHQCQNSSESQMS